MNFVFSGYIVNICVLFTVKYIMGKLCITMESEHKNVKQKTMFSLERYVYIW